MSQDVGFWLDAAAVTLFLVFFSVLAFGRGFVPIVIGAGFSAIAVGLVAVVPSTFNYLLVKVVVIAAMVLVLCYFLAIRQRH